MLRVVRVMKDCPDRTGLSGQCLHRTESRFHPRLRHGNRKPDHLRDPFRVSQRCLRFPDLLSGFHPPGTEGLDIPSANQVRNSKRLELFRGPAMPADDPSDLRTGRGHEPDGLASRPPGKARSPDRSREATVRIDDQDLLTVWNPPGNNPVQNAAGLVQRRIGRSLRVGRMPMDPVGKFPWWRRQ
jgi:hypothetical protein